MSSCSFVYYFAWTWQFVQLFSFKNTKITDKDEHAQDEESMNQNFIA